MEDLKRNIDVYKKELVLSVPIPPSINHMYYNTRGGGKRLTKKAETYFYKVKGYIDEQVRRQGWTKSSNDSWFYVDMIVYMPDKRIRDSHNMLKILFDTFQDTAVTNDYYLMPRIQSVELDKDNPRVNIVIRKQKESERFKVLSKL